MSSTTERAATAETNARLLQGAPLAALGAGLIAWLYWDVFLWWREAWTNEGYFCTHGPLIPVVSGYLIWTRVAAIQERDTPDMGAGPRDWIGGLAVVLAAGLVQLLSLRLDVRVASGFSFVVLCLGVVWLVWGRKWARELVFPLAFLVFMIPVPFLANALTVPLQDRSASVATMVGATLGMPVERAGLVLSLPNYTFEVAPTCSGINSLFSMIPLALLFVSFQVGTWWQKTLLVACAAPIALVANVCRIVLTLVLATFFGEQAAEGFFHGFSGLVLFGLALAGLFGVARAIMKPPVEAAAPLST